jgi:flagellar basal-body rod modification protein FlgD
MADLNLLNSSNTSNASWAASVPTSIRTTAQDAQAKLTAATGQAAMGQSDFLKLFTTQLTMQDPTDPVKNEAFVAQLAQFSQLEATTNMSNSLGTLSASLNSNQMMGGAGLIGKKVSVIDGPAQLTSGTPVQGIVSLPNGADGVTMQVYDAKGILVNTVTAASQPAGDMTWAWNGSDDAGNALPDGIYSFKATAMSQGVQINATVSTMSTVIGVSQQPDKTVTLQFNGGKSMKLADASKIYG